ncbi:MAG: SAM-dependent methyltransferase, partial [Candidatus Accumulibacter phosphatis]|nr:SAM-dependent methyltransferase [Candidatus Accumulibacter phosphatis]
MNALENVLTLPVATAGKPMPRSARAILALLEGLEHGSLEVRLPDGASLRFGQPRSDQSAAVLEVASWS